MAESRRQLDDEVEKLAVLREEVRVADQQVLDLRGRLETEDGAVRVARAAPSRSGAARRRRSTSPGSRPSAISTIWRRPVETRSR